jgi:hypothetical protein
VAATTAKFAAVDFAAGRQTTTHPKRKKKRSFYLMSSSTSASQRQTSASQRQTSVFHPCSTSVVAGCQGAKALRRSSVL